MVNRGKFTGNHNYGLGPLWVTVLLPKLFRRRSLQA
jgi:hypothetical protein